MSVYPYGPLSEDEFRAAVDAPYGKAADILRKHDPMWGKFPSEGGEKIRWRVELTQNVTMRAVTFVEAETEEEAEALAGMIPAQDLTFDEFVCADEGEIESVEPA